MDKRIAQPTYKKYSKSIMIVLIAAVVVLGFAKLLSTGSDSKIQHIAKNAINISRVTVGDFADTLKLRGAVSPQTTIYLDAVAGGRVEERFVEQGQYVEQGQPLVRLSNVSLQLDVMSREAQVTEQLNFLRNTQMMMTTNRLNLKRDLLEIELKLAHLTRQIKQSQPLVTQGVLAADKLATLELDLDYYQQRKALTKQRQQEEENIRQIQVQQLEESAQMLQKNLQYARQNLENLIVKAPQAGYLSELSVELGESKPRGARLGQIDIPNRFKLVANIDEYYLNQITLGMPANISLNGQMVEVAVNKIDSRVRQAQFRIEFNLPAGVNKIKRGQTLDVELVLSEGERNALLIKRGAFINSTGGNWAFVMSEDGTFAERRAVKLGKSNQYYFTVIDGLSAGEKVITSNYSAFDKADKIKVKGS
ncbi:efflux RND transporter periplasmic adaptor subunit [Thalassotalea ganghwensis]